MSGQSAPFAGANALIYGGAKGIGRAVAMEWAKRGARLAIADLAEDAAKATAAEIVAAGGTAVALAVNVLSEESIAATASAAENAFGPIDIVMNNVGGMLNGHPEDIPFAEWHRIMDINYFAAVRGCLHFLPKFLERGKGHIVNTASFAGLYPYAASRVPYGAAKAAVISMSENLAVYLEPKGIRVSCLMPGPVMTQVMDSMTSWTEDCPMRGPGTETRLMLPEELAVVLADGMAGGRIMIPSDPIGFGIVKRWADLPDGFIRAKIAEFASGEPGRPSLPESLKQNMGAEPMSNPKGRLGIEMLTLLGMPPVEYVKLAAELGCVEVSTGLSGLPLTMFGITDYAPYPMWSLKDDASLRRETIAAMRDTGVAIGLGEGFRVAPDIEAQDSEADIDIMAELGAKRINAICMDEDMVAGSTAAGDQLGILAEMAGARGMVFTMEFFPHTGITSLERALALVDYIGRGKARVLLDSTHLFRTGGTVEQVAALDPDVIGYCQLSDGRNAPPDDAYFTTAMFARDVPGQGQLPLRELIAVLPKDLTISLEVPRLDDLRGGMSPRDHAARCVAAARALGA